MEGADLNSRYGTANFEQSGVLINEGASEFVDQNMYYPAATNYGYYGTGKFKKDMIVLLFRWCLMHRVNDLLFGGFRF